MRPSAIEMLEKPTPSPVIILTRFGPPSGHFANSPVSRDRLLRSGPKNCGQVAPDSLTLAVNRTAGESATAERQRTAKTRNTQGEMRGKIMAGSGKHEGRIGGGAGAEVSGGPFLNYDRSAADRQVRRSELTFFSAACL